ncbi:D-beta-hydroxybutyrate dehydrogenase, mitochondrial isoform X1 [Gouania willdenowi]|uniref:D-beta-hydroxybutyrate dehydrogenase, mitochondrial isoform X1 n=1 Tax=Gouania willdenowi TaxID=441366 RepID=UPI0010542E03|nr:D-beta-hydroxybutyrate dehydrogenase, mitochondrial-like isoform X1 [Gouania willdenowi]
MNISFIPAQIAYLVPVLTFLILAKLLSNRNILRRRRRRPMLDGSGYGVLITGCDSGFGHQLALRLDRRGFVVFAGCLFPDGTGATNLAQSSSSNLKILKLDVTSDEQVQHAKMMVQEQLPEKGLWAVVNNAGVTDWAEIEWSTTEDFQSMLDINLMGCIRTTIAFLPLVRAAKGRMVFMSSILAFFYCLNMSAYSVSKRGLEAFADCLRVEMASFGVKVRKSLEAHFNHFLPITESGSELFFQVSIVQPGNFGPATSIVKPKTAQDIWNKLNEQQKKTFNLQYVEQVVGYVAAMHRSGFKDANVVVDAMLHAVTSEQPKPRYLLVSFIDMFFFKMFPFLPTGLSDAVFSLSSMYTQRETTLYAE